MEAAPVRFDLAFPRCAGNAEIELFGARGMLPSQIWKMATLARHRKINGYPVL
jgi:hypothetical protein